MAKLVNRIEGNILNHVVTNTNYLTGITGELQDGILINISGFMGVLQDLRNTEKTSAINTPVIFGLPNEKNLEMIIIEMNY